MKKKSVKQKRGFNTKQILSSVCKYIKIMVYGLFAGIYTTLEKGYDRFGVIVSNTSKVVKMSLFYTIIGLSIISIINYYSKLQFKHIEPEQNIVYINENESVYICNMDETSCLIYAKAIEYNVDPYLAIAISRHETGNYKSNLAVNHHNYGGNYKNGKFMSFETKEKGINYFVYNLSLYNSNDIAAIGKIYCPIGINDDGSNKYWVGGVTNIYKSLVGANNE